MPSIFPGYEYDIFISYRHNDNRSGWVTDFVKALQDELAATIKEPLSVYFDTNPHDGLLETHDVDGSLKDKIKCIVFIPIVSQTYCDPKSFAWQKEFLAFLDFTKQDQFGLDIKLFNGNVAKRVLPIRIHEIEQADKNLFEESIGGVMRPVDFIYREAGVNRPLANDDLEEKNLTKTRYKNQVNKVANAIKEIISAINTSDSVKQTAVNQPQRTNFKFSRNKIIMVSIALIILLSIVGYLLYMNYRGPSRSTLDKSIAVLPFVDMSPEQDQAYLGDGIAEEIINVLTKIRGVNVIGRTSSFSFRNRNQDLISIGKELGVATVLEGSVRKYNNKLRITAQLIDTRDGGHLWSETFDRDLDDVFAIQDAIASKIADKFKLTITLNTQLNLTQNLEAYEWYLKGLILINQGIVKIDDARICMEKAISLDSSFAAAYVALAKIYTHMGIYSRGDLHTLATLAKEAANHAIQLDKDGYMGYLELSNVDFTFYKDWGETFKNYETAVQNGMPVPNQYFAYYQSCINGNTEEGIQIIKEIRKSDPLSIENLLDLSRMYLYAGRFEEAIENSKKILQLSPANTSAQRHAGQAYLFSGQPDIALAYYSRLMEKDSTYSPDGYVGALVRLNREAEARTVFHSISKPITSVKKALTYIHLHELDSAFKYLEEAPAIDPYLSFIKTEPTFSLIREDPRYQALLKKYKFPE